MKKYEFDAVVIGTGCAGYNCAAWLYDSGYRNIAIITEGKNMGTSRNTGSDKQTYYKLSLAGDEGDSIKSMAETLFAGGAMDGDIALTEAANSVRCFIKLCNLGVEFPTNEYGEYVGYKTDHDPFRRATSIGPYTSKKMTEVLERDVLKKGIRILDDCPVIKLLKDGDGITGLLAIDRSVRDHVEYVLIQCPNVVLATGGPAGVYYDSVYPECHTGSSGLALEAGAEFVNLSEWQYGLASVDFRWNVSGTYQQVLPRYISVDENGVEREFLTGYFRDGREMLKNIFLKGYEWPFDLRKIYGSSYIDLLVYAETVIKGRKVYLDFTREPSGLQHGFDALDETAYTYLKNSDALLPLPVNRLRKMNAGAIELYQKHGIDLEKQPLRIAVSAQHNNGGVRVNDHYETNVKGLYCIGEAAGVFGVFRPGGTALNSTQVGGLRAAEHIVHEKRKINGERFGLVADAALKELDGLIAATKGAGSTLIETRRRYQKLMSKDFAFLRMIDRMERSLGEIKKNVNCFADDNKWQSVTEVAEMFKNYDIAVMSEAVACSMLKTAKSFGSRGGAYVSESSDLLERKPVAENEEGRKKVLVLKKDGEIGITETPVKPIPERDLWFEKVWNEFRKRNEN